MKKSFPASERDFIQFLSRKFTLKHPQVKLSLGDDAAAFVPDPEKTLLTTVDTLVSDVHFLDIKEDYYNIGRKSVLVNLSDIAAMGGTPRYFLLSLAVPANFDGDKLNDLLDGMALEAVNNNLVLLGGDSVGGGALTITITLIGETAPDAVICRANAQPGEGLFLSGHTGESAAGLKFLKESRVTLSAAKLNLITRHLVPPNRVELAQFLKNRFSLSSLLDLSDGLFEGIKELSLASRVGFHLDWGKVPIAKDLHENFSESEIERFCLYGGEDYELLFTAPLNKAEQIITDCQNKSKVPISLIGEVKNPEYGLKIAKDGVVKDLTGGGFQHFHF